MRTELSNLIYQVILSLIFLISIADIDTGIQAQVTDGQYALVTIGGKNTYPVEIGGKSYPCNRHGRLTNGVIYYVEPGKGWVGASPTSVTATQYKMPAIGETVYVVLDIDFGNNPGNKVFKAKVTAIGNNSFDTGKIFLDVAAEIGPMVFEGIAQHYATEAEYRALGWPPEFIFNPRAADSNNAVNGEVEKANTLKTAEVAAPVKRTPAAPGSGFKIKFDYSKADSSFTPVVREQLENAANFLARFISDDREVNVVVVADANIKAFASAAPSEWEENSDTRSVSIAGGIAFNPKSISDVNDKQSNITSLTIHELLHVLGFTESAKVYAKYAKAGQFTGPITVKMNNGNSVAGSGGHFAANIKDINGLSPRMADGGGDLLSILDLAVLADLGYTIPVIKTSSTPPNLGFTLNSNQSLTLRYPDGSPAFLIQGYGGNDSLTAGNITLKDGKKAKFLLAGGGGDDVLVSGPGDDEMRGDNGADPIYGADGKDTFVINSASGNDEILDFENGKDIILLSPSFGIADLDAYLKDPQHLKLKAVPGTEYFYEGVYLLKLGKVELSISTRDKEKPTAASFRISEWKASQ